MASEENEYIVLTIEIEPEGEQFTAEAIELGVASCGDTEEEARANITDAVNLYLGVIRLNGTRDRVFREKGIALLQGTHEVEPEARTSGQNQRILVPAG